MMATTCCFLFKAQYINIIYNMRFLLEILMSLTEKELVMRWQGPNTRINKIASHLPHFYLLFCFSVWWYDVSHSFLHPISFIAQGRQAQKDSPGSFLTILFTWKRHQEDLFASETAISFPLLLFPGLCNYGFNTIYDSFNEKLFSLGVLKTLNVVLETDSSKDIFLHAIKQSHCQ